MWYSASGNVRTEAASANRNSKKLKKFIIILDNDTLLYLPGSFLTGSVLVELDNDTPVLGKSIHVLDIFTAPRQKNIKNSTTLRDIVLRFVNNK